MQLDKDNIYFESIKIIFVARLLCINQHPCVALLYGIPLFNLYDVAFNIHFFVAFCIYRLAVILSSRLETDPGFPTLYPYTTHNPKPETRNS